MPASSKRPRGRPRLPPDQRGLPVTTWLPVPDYDRLYQRAQREEKSISSLVREIVGRRLAPTTKP